MKKNTPPYMFYATANFGSEETKRKFQAIASLTGQSMAELLGSIVRTHVSEYEKKHGDLRLP